MNSIVFPLSLAAAAIKAAVIYDDLEMADEATTLVERVAQEAGESIPCRIVPLRLHSLHQAAVGDAARLETRDAHLVVLALRDAVWLPPWLTEWLEGWAASRRTEDAAIVALGKGWHSRLSAPTLFKLRQLAQACGLTFFFDGGPSEAGGAADYFQAHPSSAWPAPWRPQTSERLPQLREWGINE